MPPAANTHGGSLNHALRQPALVALPHLCLCGHVSPSIFELTCHILTATNDVAHGTPPDRRNSIGGAGILVCADTETVIWAAGFRIPATSTQHDYSTKSEGITVNEVLAMASGCPLPPR